jgi:hypothetical protein
MNRYKILVSDFKERDNLGYLGVDGRIPLSRVLLEKLTVTQLVKKFPTFYGRRSITVFTTDCLSEALCDMRFVNNIKMDSARTGFEKVDWIELV